MSRGYRFSDAGGGSSPSTLKALVPTMTSNTTPSGECYASATASGRYPWRAFCGDPQESWMWYSSATMIANSWLAYRFNAPVCVKAVDYIGCQSDSQRDIKNGKIQGSNGNDVWEDIYTFVGNRHTDGTTTLEHLEFSNSNSYIAYRILSIDTWGNGGVNSGFALEMLQFYGYDTYEPVDPDKIKPLIPTMTSNTAPSGVASSSTDYSSSYQAWRAFDGTSTEWSSLGSRTNQWVQYSFSYPVVVKSITYSNVRNASSLSIECKFKFQASVDGATWIDLSDEMTQPAGGPACTGTLGLPSNTTAYANYRVYCAEGSAGLIVGEMQLYGYRTGDTTQYIYKDGIWNTAYLNPGSYAYSGADRGYVLEEDKLTSPTNISSIIGTATTIDVANYSTVHFKVKKITATDGAVGFISTQASYTSGTIRTVAFNSVGSIVDYTLSVTDQTSVYIGALCLDTRAMEIYEIYLTE